MSRRFFIAGQRRSSAWLEAGTRVVWVVNAQRREVTIHRAGTAPRALSDTATLTGDNVVAGFQMLVADIFTVVPNITLSDR